MITKILLGLLILYCLSHASRENKKTRVSSQIWFSKMREKY